MACSIWHIISHLHFINRTWILCFFIWQIKHWSKNSGHTCRTSTLCRAHSVCLLTNSKTSPWEIGVTNRPPSIVILHKLFISCYGTWPKQKLYAFDESLECDILGNERAHKVAKASFKIAHKGSTWYMLYGSKTWIEQRMTQRIRHIRNNDTTGRTVFQILKEPTNI